MGIRRGALESLVSISPDAFWRGKRVLVTGHSGFKGSWLSMWLHKLGADVIGVSLPPNTEPSLFALTRLDEICQSHFCDIRHRHKLRSLLTSADPDIIMHLAAQPLVRTSYRDPIETFQTNVMGTAYLLDAIRDTQSVKVAVMVTTDKVYQNAEHTTPYKEYDPLGGHDPYSASKAASELVIGGYRRAYLNEKGVAVGVARAGNVIGGGDWSKDRIIPDAVLAWQAGETLAVRRPFAIRPWQHVLEPLAGYLSLAQGLWHKPEMAQAYNFGPEADSAATVKDVIELARARFGDAAVWYASSEEGPHEAGMLMLDPQKSCAELGVSPRWTLSTAVTKTMDWYIAQGKGQDARKLCLENIDSYEGAM